MCLTMADETNLGVKCDHRATKEHWRGNVLAQEDLQALKLEDPPSSPASDTYQLGNWE